MTDNEIAGLVVAIVEADTPAARVSVAETVKGILDGIVTCGVLVPREKFYGWEKDGRPCEKSGHAICEEHFQATMRDHGETIARLNEDRERIRSELASLARSVLRESKARADVLTRCLKAVEGEADPMESRSATYASIMARGGL